MARRTKEDALATRDGILDAAEQLFLEQGVSRTTLQHIATAAGVTRGAIYWHFDDKAALVNAMLERAKMPLESALELLDNSRGTDPLADLREYMMSVIRLTVEDPKARRVFEIVTFKLEYVEELTAVRERRLEGQARWMARAEGRIKSGVSHGQLKPGIAAHAVALGLLALMDGLIRTWLLDPQAFDLIALGGQIVDMHLDSLRADGPRAPQ